MMNGYMHKIFLSNLAMMVSAVVSVVQQTGSEYVDPGWYTLEGRRRLGL